MADWTEKTIKGVLLDISGVLFDSGPSGGEAIPGSIEAVKKLRASGIPVRFCTNETTITRGLLADKLGKLGFEVAVNEIFAPIPAMCKILSNKGLRPFLVVTPECLPDFEGVDQSNPNCVVIADAQSEFSYENMNKAFQTLISLDNPVLFALGKGKYYKHGNNLVLDTGPYMKALEFACDLEAEVVGKPSVTFFTTAMEDMGVTADTCVMVGDDIVGDVGGAQSAGLRGVQVRTGKYRPQDENHPTIKPDGFVDNLAQAVEMILARRK